MLVEIVETVSVSTAANTELQTSWTAAVPYIPSASWGRLRQRVPLSSGDLFWRDSRVVDHPLLSEEPKCQTITQAKHPCSLLAEGK
jgi:hypothetical protein